MAILRDTVVVNGDNLGDFGLQWQNRSGWGDSPRAQVVTHRLPDGDGVFFQEVNITAPRLMTISGIVHASDVSTLLGNIDDIKSRLEGLIKVSFSDDSDRFVAGRKESLVVGDFQPGAIVPTKPYTLKVVCPDPRRYSNSVTSVGEGAPCPLGTANVRPVITITGPSADPTTVALKDYQGNTVSTFTIAASLSSGESWLIDSETAQVLHDDGAGTVTSVLSSFSGTLPNLKQEDADFGSSAWPSFTATAGSPDSMVISYQKAWQ